jgi:hypothetical protein
MRNHAFLTWYRVDLEETVLLDWTISPKPLTAEEVTWSMEDEVGLWDRKG